MELRIREFVRTQREAGIDGAPWADQAALDRAAGFLIGLVIPFAVFFAVVAALSLLLPS
jgi:hypothetical protein